MEIIDVIKALAKNYNIKEVIFYKESRTRRVML